MGDGMAELDEIRDKVIKTIQKQSREKVEIHNGLRYYFGRQWNDEDLAQLVTTGRRPLVYNYLARIVNFFYGFISQQHFAERFYPARELSVFQDNLAYAVSGLVKNIYKRDHVEDKLKSVFLTGVLTGQAFLQPYVDFSRDPNGQIRVRVLDPRLVYWDPFATEPDIEDAEYLFEINYLSKEKLLELFPEKEDVIDRLPKKFLFKLPIHETLPLIADYGEIAGIQIAQVSQITPTEKYEVVRYQEKFSENLYFIKDNTTGTYYEVPRNLDEKEVLKKVRESKKEGVSLTLEKKRVKRVKITSFCGDEVLEEIVDPYGIPDYDVVPMWGYNVLGKTKGIYHDAKYPQDDINRRKSYALEVLRHAPAGKWWVRKGTWSTDSERAEAEDKLEDESARIIEINPGVEAPQPLQADSFQVIAALNSLEMRGEQQLKDILGMTDALLGTLPRRIQSARAVSTLQQQAMVYVSSYLDNYMTTRKRLAYLVFKIAQRVIPSDYPLLIEREGQEPQMLMLNQQLGKEINVLSLVNADLDVECEIVGDTPTERDEKFKDVLKAAQLRLIQPTPLVIPPEIILRLMNLPFKQEIMAYNKQVQQAMQQGQGAPAAPEQQQEQPQTERPIGNLPYEQRGRGMERR